MGGPQSAGEPTNERRTTNLGKNFEAFRTMRSRLSATQASCKGERTHASKCGAGDQEPDIP